MNIYFAFFFLAISAISIFIGICNYVDLKSGKYNYEEELKENIFASFVAGIAFFLMSHIAPSGRYETISVRPSNSEFYGKTICINGEQKTITAKKRGLFWFSDGTSANPEYVRGLVNLRKTEQREMTEWKWIWERF